VVGSGIAASVLLAERTATRGPGRLEVGRDPFVLHGRHSIRCDSEGGKGPGRRSGVPVTGRGSALPIASSGTNYKADQLTLDGRPAGVASYRVADPNYPERRSLLWTFAGRNDGSGKNLVLDLSCKETGCAVFLPMIGSLDAKP
jgi:hypothetical protein